MERSEQGVGLEFLRRQISRSARNDSVGKLILSTNLPNFSTCVLSFRPKGEILFELYIVMTTR